MSIWKTSARSLIVDIISRKFIVFICATLLLYLGRISAEIWLYVSAAYMAANVFENLTSNYFTKKQEG